MSFAALVLYGVVTYTHGFPQNASERTSWALVVALPIAGIVFGA